MKKPFQFEPFWLKDPTCEPVVSCCWNIEDNGSPTYRLCLRTKNTKKGLREWNKSHFGSLQDNIAQLRKNLEAVQSLNTRKRCYLWKNI